MEQIYQEIEGGKNSGFSSKTQLFLSQEEEDSIIVSIRAAINNQNIQEYKEKVRESQEEMEESVKGIVRQSQK